MSTIKISKEVDPQTIHDILDSQIECAVITRQKNMIEVGFAQFGISVFVKKRALELSSSGSKFRSPREMIALSIVGVTLSFMARQFIGSILGGVLALVILLICGGIVLSSTYEGYFKEKRRIVQILRDAVEELGIAK